MRHRLKTFLGIALISFKMSAATVDFDRHVRPILSDRCYQCHGPDAGQRKARLRLDLPPDQLGPAERSNLNELINPGKAGESEFIRRLFTTDDDDLMPPPDSGLELSKEEKAILKQWVAEGADYRMLWSFVTPISPPLPAVKEATWSKNEIDRFILHRLETAGRKPSPPADRRTLIRRLGFDLTGLPPTPAEIAAFLNDPAPNAVETVIDRLLRSERFGERQAADWMDAARYADTSGYQYDWPRRMYRWRAWVIDAFNRGLPYNLFIQWQIAGDLFPNAHQAQIVATGFNRNHGFTIESGTIDEEYRVQYVNDRVTTMGTAFLGLTLECARCHDHKYDPISQQDYYRLFAFFNNLNEAGTVAGKPSFTSPAIPTPSPNQIQRVQQLGALIQRLDQTLHQPDSAADAKQAAWAKAYESPWRTVDKRPARKFSFNLGSQSLERLGVTIPYPTNRPISAIRLVLNPKSAEEIPAGTLFGLSDFKVWQSPANGSSNQLNIVRIESAASPGENLTRLLTDDIPGSTWGVDYGKPTVLVAAPARPIDGAGTLFVDLEVNTPLEVYFDFSATFSSQLQPHRHDRTGRLDDHLRAPADEAAQREIRRSFRGNHDPNYRTVFDQLIAAERELQRLRTEVPMTMIMRDETERETFVLDRGAYDRKKDKVTAGTPARLPGMPAGAPLNRLGLAQWLTTPENPLVARVAVNRYWQQLFGNGLVRTPEDFGSQGERPSHPQLLDWLAVDFVRNGWNVKALIKKICLSATYQQASINRTGAADWDAENRQLSRYPRQRLSAEMVRDNALAISGLLAEMVGGDSVNPYQPAGLWEQLTNREKYQQKYLPATGDDLYRRSLYTFWKRASHHPVMALFDAPSREVCTVRRPVTNTPLQALALMNETLFVETARGLATRMLTDLRFGRNDEQRIAHAFQLATSRVPYRLENYALRQLLEHERHAFAQDPGSATQLLSVGASGVPTALDPIELAAFTMVARAILNLSETITKP